MPYLISIFLIIVIVFLSIKIQTKIWLWSLFNFIMISLIFMIPFVIFGNKIADYFISKIILKNLESQNYNYAPFTKLYYPTFYSLVLLILSIPIYLISYFLAKLYFKRSPRSLNSADGNIYLKNTTQNEKVWISLSAISTTCITITISLLAISTTSTIFLISNDMNSFNNIADSFTSWIFNKNLGTNPEYIYSRDMALNLKNNNKINIISALLRPYNINLQSLTNADIDAIRNNSDFLNLFQKTIANDGINTLYKINFDDTRINPNEINSDNLNLSSSLFLKKFFNDNNIHLRLSLNDANKFVNSMAENFFLLFDQSDEYLNWFNANKNLNSLVSQDSNLELEITSLKNKLADAKRQVNILDQKVNDLSIELSSANTKLASAQSNLSTITSAFASIQLEWNRLNNALAAAQNLNNPHDIDVAQNALNNYKPTYNSKKLEVDQATSEVENLKAKANQIQNQLDNAHLESSNNNQLISTLESDNNNLNSIIYKEGLWSSIKSEIVQQKSKVNNLKNIRDFTKKSWDKSRIDFKNIYKNIIMN